ncbi:MAG: YeeE/YedE family protein [Pseudomonadales bacterium]|nr:YeeE/YedE family protein [Pseudomonadales bacterium]
MFQIIALIAGTLFGLGLAVSGMSDTQKVIGFLDIFGHWDASLMFVMAVGIAATAPAFHFILRRSKPLIADKFYLPCNTAIDKKLLLGSALFGIGWGLYGYCPGPAIASLSYLNIDSAAFVASMLAGMFVANKAFPA